MSRNPAGRPAYSPPMPARTLTRIGYAALAAAALLATGCARQTRPVPEGVDDSTAARLRLTEDAKDPTVRDDEAGYNRWRPKPEPEGTAAPLSPARRRIDRRP